MVKWWAFLGMLAQVPLIKMTNWLKGHQLGNVIFWFSIVLGQPFIVLLMYRGWYQRHYGATILSDM
jgi:diacylglycerol O-acyltransferase-1